jgi:hypothetical protein
VVKEYYFGVDDLVAMLKPKLKPVVVRPKAERHRGVGVKPPPGQRLVSYKQQCLYSEKVTTTMHMFLTAVKNGIACKSSRGKKTNNRNGIR